LFVERELDVSHGDVLAAGKFRIAYAFVQLAWFKEREHTGMGVAQGIACRKMYKFALDADFGA
jgi:hypothetical protein